jgi:hypothetical protein
MTVFTVIYSFQCPHCKHLYNGKKLYRASNEAEASHRLPTAILRCDFCTPPTAFTVTTKTLVSPATDEDLATSQVEPDP